MSTTIPVASNRFQTLPASNPPVLPWEPPGVSAPDSFVKGPADSAPEPQEPPALHGEVYEEYPDGSTRVLKTSGQTTPTAGPKGPDIPADAVKNQRVFIYVDGIHTQITEQQQDIHNLFESSGGNPAMTNVGQPTIGIQEGVGASFMDDAIRIGRDFEGLKALQGGYAPKDEAQQLYQIDPAIKAIHDEVLQSLVSGRDVVMGAHSGGGAETAAALTILAHEGYQTAISQHVRLLECAPAAAPEDYIQAGVKPENLYYTGSHKDPVWSGFHTYVPPTAQGQILLNAVAALLALGSAEDAATQKDIPNHSPYMIFPNNMTPDGKSRIQEFLNGGPGGNYSY